MPLTDFSHAYGFRHAQPRLLPYTHAMLANGTGVGTSEPSKAGDAFSTLPVYIDEHDVLAELRDQRQVDEK